MRLSLFKVKRIQAKATQKHGIKWWTTISAPSAKRQEWTQDLEWPFVALQEDAVAVTCHLWFVCALTAQTNSPLHSGWCCSKPVAVWIVIYSQGGTSIGFDLFDGKMTKQMYTWGIFSTTDNGKVTISDAYEWEIYCKYWHFRKWSNLCRIIAKEQMWMGNFCLKCKIRYLWLFFTKREREKQKW